MILCSILFQKDFNLDLSSMKAILSGLVLIISVITEGCIEKFTPVLHANQYYIVVNGLITNRPEVYTVKLSWSITPGENTSVPLPGCDVTVHDDMGHVYQFTESSVAGIYNSDTTTFQGVVGRKYTLHINTNNATTTHYSYESIPVEMKAVPPIDSLFYEKVIIKEATLSGVPQEGCKIYLNTYDPDGNCRFYRWNYTETWIFQIPFHVTNQICWISNSPENIDIKSTSVLSEDVVNHHSVTFISNESDRLSLRYSIIVDQYSLSENEFAYWEKIRNVTQKVGGLYDIIPSSIAGNIYCVEDPDEEVLGYFSVSAETSKRIYIDEIFRGLVNPYKDCIDDSVWTDYPTNIRGIDVYCWIIQESHDLNGTFYILTEDHRCADCTVRGTTTKPEFWEDFK